MRVDAGDVKDSSRGPLTHRRERRTLEARVDGLALQCQDGEDTLVHLVQGFMVDEAL
jgi:hypothetical protein